MSTERDELKAHIHDSAVPVNGRYVLTDDCVADELLAAGYRKPRQVTTVEELDALPEGTMILDGDPDALVTDGIFWRSLLVPEVNLRSADIALPATVLHVGGAA